LTGRIPLRDLPALPSRGQGFFMEPLCGIFVVGIFSMMFVGMVHAIGASNEDLKEKGVVKEMSVVPMYLVWAEAGVAALCVLFLLFGGSGVIRRSEKTCYPMPPEVEQRLRTRRSLEGLTNVEGPEKSSYCVRCLVWRPPVTAKDKTHHCVVCSRCVKGFDHHCGVFGRCIVRGNMPCFVVLIAMLPAGFVTAFLSIIAGGMSTRHA